MSGGNLLAFVVELRLKLAAVAAKGIASGELQALDAGMERELDQVVADMTPAQQLDIRRWIRKLLAILDDRIANVLDDAEPGPPG